MNGDGERNNERYLPPSKRERLANTFPQEMERNETGVGSVRSLENHVDNTASRNTNLNREDGVRHLLNSYIVEQLTCYPDFKPLIQVEYFIDKNLERESIVIWMKLQCDRLVVTSDFCMIAAW